MGSIGIEVREKDLETVSTKIKLLNSQIWCLEEGFAVKYCYLFERGEKVPVQVDRVGINTIYPKIRFVFDKKNNVIAERACAGARLRTTRENNWLFINKRGIQIELYIFTNLLRRLRIVNTRRRCLIITMLVKVLKEATRRSCSCLNVYCLLIKLAIFLTHSFLAY
ncbi:hypothetical protein ACIL82_13100 [Enterococcus faecium]